ncbi:MAG: MMPL family transporter [Candidatus Sulfotelmatobacter sp.]
MMVRCMRWVGRLVVGHPGLVTAASLVVTLLLYANIHNLRTGTDLTDLFGNRDPQWRAASEIGKELGYGNQLFVLIEAPNAGTSGGADTTGEMEEMADRLTADMLTSGLFLHARCGLQDEELLNMVRFFTWNFPSFALPGEAEDLKRRLDPKQIHQTVRRAATELITPFSSLGTNYFVADPLGLMEVEARGGRGFSQFANFDLNWGSGNRFFSKDHKALLIIAEPRQSAMDYKFAEQVVHWTRDHIRSMTAEPDFRDSGVHALAAGAYVYAEQEHQFIETNIRRISLISIVGNLLLCLVIYPRIPLLLLSLLPAGLGILWTTGIASFYPGEVNLISLSFIAILAGLGDDQVVHFFNRVPQEWAKAGVLNDATLNNAVLRTFETTGLSVVFCIVTAATATAALATSSFKALAEFGFILTVGMFMMMFHTLLTVPALMGLWWRVSKPRAPQTITFRILPWIARKAVEFVGRHPRVVVGLGSGMFLLSLFFLPAIKLGGHFDIAGADNPAVAAQNRLSARFGIEGSPNVLLISGGEQEVLGRAEKLTAGLEAYQQRGVIKSIFSPTALLPSTQTQNERARSLAGVNYAASARALEESLRENGFRIEPLEPFIDRLRKLGQGKPGQEYDPVTLETAAKFLPPGLLDNSIRKMADGSYVAAIAFYGTDPDAVEVVPESVIASWRNQYGPFVEFSFDKMNRDMQNQVLHDSRRALVWTAAGILLIVYLTFRSLRVSLIVLIPIVFGIVVTFGLLLLMRHRFSFMSITAIPLIIGIGIDNGIHLVRRYLESRPLEGGRLENDSTGILVIAKASGAAIIQSNLTTIVGFGALMASSFAPLAEMGLVTSLGVALALAGGLLLIPAVILLGEQRRAATGAATHTAPKKTSAG